MFLFWSQKDENKTRTQATIAARQGVWNKDWEIMATADLITMMDKKTSDKAKALESALQQIERQFGKGSIMRLGGGETISDIPAISTGSISLDMAPVTPKLRFGSSTKS